MCVYVCVIDFLDAGRGVEIFSWKRNLRRRKTEDICTDDNSRSAVE